MQIALRLVVLILVLAGTSLSMMLDKGGSFLTPTSHAPTVASGPFPGPLPQPQPPQS